MKKEQTHLEIRVTYDPNRLADKAEADAYQLLYPEKSPNSGSCLDDTTAPNSNSQQKENAS